MAAEGYSVPALPCALIEAKDRKEAAEKILLISSSYGKMTNNSLEQFLTENDLELPELDGELELPSIDMDFFRNADFEPSGADDQGRLDKKNPITCPSCGHEFVP